MTTPPWCRERVMVYYEFKLISPELHIGFDDIDMTTL